PAPRVVPAAADRRAGRGDVLLRPGRGGSFVSWLRAWAPPLLWAAVLFSISSQPRLPGGLGGGLDKVAHFGAFAVLGLLLARAALSYRLPIGWPIALGLIYGA